MDIYYSLVYYIGYFSIFLVFSILAIVFAKNKAGWILFGVGAGLQGLSLWGKQLSFNRFGSGNAMSGLWSAYIIMVIIVVIVIFRRQNDF